MNCCHFSDGKKLIVVVMCIGCMETCEILKITLCLLRRHRHRNFSTIVPAGPYKMVYSYETLTPPPAYICQYNFVHNFAGTLDTA